MKREACNIVSTNPGLENHGKNIWSVSEMIHLFISEKIVEEMCIDLSKKTKSYIRMFK